MIYAKQNFSSFFIIAHRSVSLEAPRRFFHLFFQREKKGAEEDPFVPVDTITLVFPSCIHLEACVYIIYIHAFT